MSNKEITYLKLGLTKLNLKDERKEANEEIDEISKTWGITYDVVETAIEGNKTVEAAYLTGYSEALSLALRLIEGGS